MKFRDKMARWMYGRYGVDSLGRCTMYGAVICLVLSLFIFRKPLYLISIILLVVTYFRAFSKNIQKRYNEAMTFEKWKKKVKKLPDTIASRRTHHIYRCPGCRQKIRVPRGKGNIEITCPKCKTKFIKRS